MAILRMFKSSAMELKNLRCLTVTAMMIALDIALKSVTINLGDSLKVSFAFLALATIGMLYGPTVSFFAGAITDILGFMIFPSGGGGFNPLFTLIEATGALLYGLFLYKLNPIRFDWNETEMSAVKKVFRIIAQTWRVILAKVTVVIICNLIMTPMANVICGYWSVETAIARFPDRFIKNCIQCPVDCVLLIVILYPVLVAYRSIFKNKVNDRTKAKTATSSENKAEV